mmetsp:Transcript_24295/g.37449  ORF Transcript_24295/g.37449 Transcript_24295/m.37449 type:complete len:367 (-) Transcript_24295:554-1654(-)
MCRGIPIIDAMIVRGSSIYHFAMPLDCGRSARQGAIRASRRSEFSPYYHATVIGRETLSLGGYLLKGTSIWLVKLIRLLSFVTVLFPAFLVFGWYYFTCNRTVFRYIEDDAKSTSRHYLDVYGAAVDDFEQNGSQHADGNVEISRSASPTSSSGSNEFVQQQMHAGKPVVVFLTGGAWIIGYKMWGALLARALVPHNVIVVIPDYRNFPQTRVDGMVEDIDASIQWVFDNCREFGGDPNRVVLVGQSAGAHLGSCILINKALASCELKSVSSHARLPTTTWKGTDLKGFVATSGPYDLLKMQDIFHQHGLDRHITQKLFRKNLVEFSPMHMLQHLRSIEKKKIPNIIPPVLVLHGTDDKTVRIFKK